MDAPTNNIAAIEELANDRKAWKTMLNERFPKKNTPSMKTKSKSRPPPPTTINLPAPQVATSTPTTVAAAKPPKASAMTYCHRDNHECFLRRGKTRKTRQPKKKKPKPRAMTNKERQAFARAHYAQHHNDDKDHCKRDSGTTRPRPIETAAAMQLVFDSYSDSSTNDILTTTYNSNTTTDYIPQFNSNNILPPVITHTPTPHISGFHVHQQPNAHEQSYPTQSTIDSIPISPISNTSNKQQISTE